MKRLLICFALLAFCAISCEKGTDQSELTKIKKEAYPTIESEIDIGESIASDKEVIQAYREILQATTSSNNARSNENKWRFGIVQMSM